MPALCSLVGCGVLADVLHWQHVLVVDLLLDPSHQLLVVLEISFEGGEVK